MKIFNSLFFKGIVPVSLMACSFSGFSAMEVKGFELAEQDKIRNVFGACHRLEEPLTIKLYMNTDFVAAGAGWRAEIRYRLQDEKKYITDYFSADDIKLSNGQGNEQIFTGPTYVTSVKDGTRGGESKVYGNDGSKDYYLVLPSRNIDFLDFRIFSYSNGNGGSLAWTERDGNYLFNQQGNFSKGLNNPRSFTLKGISDYNTGRFNLLNIDYLEVSFVQYMTGTGFYPDWKITAHEMKFRDRGPYTAAQYKAACQ